MSGIFALMPALGGEAIAPLGSKGTFGDFSDKTELFDRELKVTGNKTVKVEYGVAISGEMGEIALEAGKIPLDPSGVTVATATAVEPNQENPILICVGGKVVLEGGGNGSAPQPEWTSKWESNDTPYFVIYVNHWRTTADDTIPASGSGEYADVTVELHNAPAGTYQMAVQQSILSGDLVLSGVGDSIERPISVGVPVTFQVDCTGSGEVLLTAVSKSSTIIAPAKVPVNGKNLVYHILDPTGAGGMGHSAVIAKNPDGGYSYHSFAPAPGQFFPAKCYGRMTTERFTTLEKAFDFARKKGYTEYQAWPLVSAANLKKAVNAWNAESDKMDAATGTSYNVTLRNCWDAAYTIICGGTNPGPGLQPIDFGANPGANFDNNILTCTKSGTI